MEHEGVLQMSICCPTQLAITKLTNVDMIFELSDQGNYSVEVKLQLLIS